MNCPKCGGKTGVYDSRLSEIDGLSYIWRRRKCQCGHRFTTYESDVPPVAIQTEHLQRQLQYIKEAYEDLLSDTDSQQA